MYTVHEVCQWTGALALVNSVFPIVTVDTPYHFHSLSHNSHHGEVKLETSQLMVKVLNLETRQASVVYASHYAIDTLHYLLSVLGLSLHVLVAQGLQCTNAVHGARG